MKLLIAIRNLPYSQATISFGGFIASLEPSSVTLMTTIGPDQERAAAEKMLAEAQRHLPVDNVQTRVRWGQPLDQILTEARQGNYDLVVVGWREMEQVTDALLGALSQRVAVRAINSVLVVKKQAVGIRRILLAIGEHNLPSDVVTTGSRLAKAAGARVTLLHVAKPVPAMYTGLDQMEETLEELLQSDTPLARHLHWAAEYLADEGVEADLELRRGEAADEILRRVHQGEHDLIVLEAPPANGLLQRLLAVPVAAQVVERAPCPVLIVRPPATGEEE